MTKYPALTALWLGEYGFTVRCRKTPDGTVSAEHEDHGVLLLSCRSCPVFILTSIDVVMRRRENFNSSWDDVEFDL